MLQRQRRGLLLKPEKWDPQHSRNSVLHVPLSGCGSAALIVISAGVFLQVPGGLALRLSARLPRLAARSRLWIQPDLIFSRFMQFSCLFPLLVINFLLGKMKIKSNDFYAYIQLLNIHCLSWVLSSGLCPVQVNIWSTVLCWRKMELHYSNLFFLLANLSQKGLNWAQVPTSSQPPI